MKATTLQLRRLENTSPTEGATPSHEGDATSIERLCDTPQTGEMSPAHSPAISAPRSGPITSSTHRWP